MDNKRVWVIVGLVVLALGAWFLVRYLNSIKVDPVVVEQLQWKIVDRGLNPGTGSTTSRVYLTVAGVDVQVGDYTGICELIDATSTPLLSGEISGVICLSGNAGKEVGIFSEGGKLVLKDGDVEIGADRSVGKRSNFVQREGL